jgi:hypothetical protein
MKKNLYFILAIVLLLSTYTLSSFGQTDTIGLENKTLMTSQLKPGLTQYLVYFQFAGKKKNLLFWYWLRDIKIENRNGEKVFAIAQHWYGNDTNIYRALYSINKAVDFTPLYHSETAGNVIKAYNWYPDKITGADTVTKNAQKGFSLDFKIPNFNWNLDIETFEMLPLEEGKTFAINFYDAGLIPPDYVLYKVIGSEVITMQNNEKVDCWKLFTESDHEGNHYTETYWISKKRHEFLKEEDQFKGGYRYKIRMPIYAPDLLQRFK